jgi:hypothetical protein
MRIPENIHELVSLLSIRIRRLQTAAPCRKASFGSDALFAQGPVSGSCRVFRAEHLPDRFRDIPSERPGAFGAKVDAVVSGVSFLPLDHAALASYPLSYALPIPSNP